GASPLEPDSARRSPRTRAPRSAGSAAFAAAPPRFAPIACQPRRAERPSKTAPAAVSIVFCTRTPVVQVTTVRVAAGLAAEPALANTSARTVAKRAAGRAV